MKRTITLKIFRSSHALWLSIAVLALGFVLLGSGMDLGYVIPGVCCAWRPLRWAASVWRYRPSCSKP